MSLSGLDAQDIADAVQSAQNEDGGWLLLYYVSRGEVKLLKSGFGGLTQLRAAITEYGEESPVFAVLFYRQDKIVCKYIPDGTSRLVQARTHVHLSAIVEHFSSSHQPFNASRIDDFTDENLASSFPPFAASLLTTESTRPNNNQKQSSRGSTSKDVEDSSEMGRADRQSPIPNKMDNEEVKTPTSVATSHRERNGTFGRLSNEGSMTPTKPSNDFSNTSAEDGGDEITSSNPEVASILAKIRAERRAIRSESPNSMISDFRSITSDERPRVSRILARLKAEKEEHTKTPEALVHEDETNELATPVTTSTVWPDVETTPLSTRSPLSVTPMKIAGEADQASVTTFRPDSRDTNTTFKSGAATRTPRKESNSHSHRHRLRTDRSRTKSSEKLWTPEQISQELANFNPNVGPRPLDQSEIKRPKTAESRRMRLPKGLRALARKATQESIGSSKSNKTSRPATNADAAMRPETSPYRPGSSGPSAKQDMNELSGRRGNNSEIRPRTGSPTREEKDRSLSLDKPVPPLPSNSNYADPESQRLMKALQMRHKMQQVIRTPTEPTILHSHLLKHSKEPPELNRIITGEAPRSDSGVDIGSQFGKKDMPSLHMALHGNPVNFEPITMTASPETVAPTSAGALETEMESEVFYDASTSPPNTSGLDWNPSVLDAIRLEMQKNNYRHVKDDGMSNAYPDGKDRNPMKRKENSVSSTVKNPKEESSREKDSPVTQIGVVAGSSHDVSKTSSPKSVLGDPFNFHIDPNEASFFLSSPEFQAKKPRNKPSLEPVDTSVSTVSAPSAVGETDHTVTGTAEKSIRAPTKTSSKRKSNKTRASVAPSLGLDDGDSDSDNALYGELQSAIVEEAQRVQFTSTPTSAVQQSGMSPVSSSKTSPKAVIDSKVDLPIGIRKASVNTIVVGSGPSGSAENKRKESIEAKQSTIPMQQISERITKTKRPTEIRNQLFFEPQMDEKAPGIKIVDGKNKRSNENSQISTTHSDKVSLRGDPGTSGHHKSTGIAKRMQALADITSRRDQGNRSTALSSAMSVKSNDARHMETSSIKDLPDIKSYLKGDPERPSIGDDHRPPSSIASTKASKSFRRRRSQSSTSLQLPLVGDLQNKQNSVSYTARIVRPNYNDIHEIQEDVPYSPVSLVEFQQTPVTVDHGTIEYSRLPGMSRRHDDRPDSARPQSRESGVSTFTRHSIEQGRRFFGGFTGHSHRPSSRDNTTQHTGHMHMHSRSNTSTISSPLSNQKTQNLPRVEEPPPSPEQSEKKSSRTGRLWKRVSVLNAAARKPLVDLSLKFAGVAEADEPLSPRRKGAAPLPVAIGDINVQLPDSLFWKRRWVEVDLIGNLVLSDPINRINKLRGVTTPVGVVKSYHLTSVRTPFIPTTDREELPYSIFIELVEGGSIQLACEDPIGQGQVLRRLVDVHRAWIAYNT